MIPAKCKSGALTHALRALLCVPQCRMFSCMSPCSPTPQMSPLFSLCALQVAGRTVARNEETVYTYTPALADDLENRVRWERYYSQLSPRQRRKAVTRGGSRITLSALVMIDTGATRDFISRALVKEKNLRTVRAPAPLEVTVADEKKLMADRMVILTLSFQGYTYTKPMYVLPLGVTATVILGSPFLEAISPFSCDYRKDARTISFRHRGREVTLNPSPIPLPGMPILDMRKAMLEMRVARRLLKSAGDDATQAYLYRRWPYGEVLEAHITRTWYASVT